MTTEEQIKETKNNCLNIEVALIGDGSEDNSFRADIPKGCYTHLDADNDIDYVNKKVKIYINKLKTKKTILTKIRGNPKIKIIKEKGV